ncbi:MAG: tetratricopeptide repeat protein [Spirochaetales bacterium]|nr:tetratricopeptide repeat protein [Spirochaetales bacterium]
MKWSGIDWMRLRCFKRHCLYRAGDWDRAEQAFRDLLASHGADRATRLFLARIEHMRKHAPTEDWTGVWHMKSK